MPIYGWGGPVQNQICMGSLEMPSIKQHLPLQCQAEQILFGVVGLGPHLVGMIRLGMMIGARIGRFGIGSRIFLEVVGYAGWGWGWG